MDALTTDIRYGLRKLLKNPGLSLVAVLTIALGTGLTTHTFSVVYGSVLRGLDFDRGTQLLSLSHQDPERGMIGWPVPYVDILDWREEQSVFRGIAALSWDNTMNLADEGSPPERFQGAYASANLFEQVDGVPLLGRTFDEAEEAGNADRVAVISYNVWQNRYAGAEDVIGRTIRVNSEATTIVGVMPEGFHFPFQEDVWLPLRVDPATAERGQNRYTTVARLLEGVSIEQAEAQMNQIAARIGAEYPVTNEGTGVLVQTYEDTIMPPAIVAVLGVMLVAVFGVLLIACFNVANLLLARSAARSREVAVRSALGAGRRRIIRQFLIEAGVLSVAGGLLGIAVAYVGINAFNAAILDIEKPYWIDVRMDGPVLAFSIAVMAFAGIAAGTLPAIRATGGKLNEILQDESRGSTGFRIGRLSGVLVVGELALSCALLVAAGMMVKSVVNVATYDLGFEEEGIFTGRIGLAAADYPDDESLKRFYEELTLRFQENPAVESVALTTSLPAIGSPTARIALEDAVYADLRDRPVSNYAVVSADYFEVLGVEPVSGRMFEEQDRLGTVPVTIVNESFARRHYGDASPLGQRIQPGEQGAWLTIVGVIPDIYVGGGGPGGIGADQVLPEQYFQPLAQVEGVRFVSVAARTRGDAGAFATPAREIVASLDPGLPLYFGRTMAETIETGTWVFKIFGSLFAIFAIAALFMAAVGLYGVMAFSVTLRTQELAIRMAMGAERSNVFRLVLSKGMLQLGVGAVLGLAMGALMARSMELVFFDVDPADPMVYATILLTMAAAGFLACALPARRAVRVQLVDALRPD